MVARPAHHPLRRADAMVRVCHQPSARHDTYHWRAHRRGDQLLVVVCGVHGCLWVGAVYLNSALMGLYRASVMCVRALWLRGASTTPAVSAAAASHNTCALMSAPARAGATHTHPSVGPAVRVVQAATLWVAVEARGAEAIVATLAAHSLGPTSAVADDTHNSDAHAQGHRQRHHTCSCMLVQWRAAARHQGPTATNAATTATATTAHTTQ